MYKTEKSNEKKAPTQHLVWRWFSVGTKNEKISFKTII